MPTTLLHAAATPNTRSRATPTPVATPITARRLSVSVPVLSTATVATRPKTSNAARPRSQCRAGKPTHRNHRNREPQRARRSRNQHHQGPLHPLPDHPGTDRRQTQQRSNPRRVRATKNSSSPHRGDRHQGAHAHAAPHRATRRAQNKRPHPTTSTAVHNTGGTTSGTLTQPPPYPAAKRSSPGLPQLLQGSRSPISSHPHASLTARFRHGILAPVIRAQRDRITHPPRRSQSRRLGRLY